MIALFNGVFDESDCALPSESGKLKYAMFELFI